LTFSNPPFINPPHFRQINPPHVWRINLHLKKCSGLRIRGLLCVLSYLPPSGLASYGKTGYPIITSEGGYAISFAFFNRFLKRAVKLSPNFLAMPAFGV
jgi:hypothetical protein